MIKITVFTDTHFGFSINEETENDSHELVEEIAKNNKDSDIIIICGDVFHTRNPKIKIVEKAISSLKNFLEIQSKVKLVETDKKIDNLKLKSIEKNIPIITINGNHDRSYIGEASILDLMDEANLLINLNSNYIIFEKDGQKISIFGMGNMPENVAKDYLYKNIKHFKDCTNILLIHQNIYPFIFYSPDYSLTMDNLPRNFDLIINGHYHAFINESIGKTKILMPGSLITTQLKKEESNLEKSYTNIYIDEGNIKIEKVGLKRYRKFFYLEFGINDDKEKITNEINKILSKEYIKKPIVKVVVKREKNEDLSYLTKEFSNKCILLTKTELIGNEKTIEEVSKENIESIFDFAIKKIKSNIGDDEFPIKIENLIKMLEDKDSIEKIINILMNKQKTL
ncbi:MAG: DNA repair exonuclease [Candidatus Aenigmatarchaeota archaeon]